MEYIEKILKKENENTHLSNLEKVRDEYEVFSEIKEKIENLESHFTKMKSNFRIPTFELNNKLVELNREFKNNNIYMNAKYRYVPDGIFALSPGISESFVGISILTDLTNKFNNCIDCLEEYLCLLTDPSGITNNKLINRIMRKTKKPMEEIIYTDKDRTILSELRKEYNKNDDAIFNYNLKENLIDSIISTIKYYNLTPNTIAILMEDDIIPDLHKLGLANQISLLKEKINEECKKEIPQNKTMSAKGMSLYIPDYKSSRELRTIAIANPNLSPDHYYNFLYNPVKSKTRKITK